MILIKDVSVTILIFIMKIQIITVNDQVQPLIPKQTDETKSSKGPINQSTIKLHSLSKNKN